MDSYKKSRRKSIIAWVIAFVLAIGAAIVSFTPFIFMVLNSFKEKFEMLTKGVFQLPDQLNWSNYTEVLTGGFANYFKNSVIVLAVSLILLLFISACASYPLARFKFKMAQPIYAIIVACMSIPVHITLIPVFKMSKSTGLYDTNYENKVAAALEALRTDDFVYLHIEASDEAGHEGDFKLKQFTIENLDKRVVGPVYEAVKDWDEPVAIAVLPDHPTPCELRTHTAEPVPFLIYYPGIEPDNVQTFDEVACVEGSYGVMKEDEFMNEFMTASALHND